MSLGPVADWSWASAVTNGKGGRLTEIWCRSPNDMLNAQVPLFVETLVGDDPKGGFGLRHQVQVPPGVEVHQKLWIPRGHCICLYSDGTYRKYHPRDATLWFRGADLEKTDA